MATAMAELTAKQLDMLRHMLGINDRSKKHPKPYRNYAAVEPGDALLVELERLGMVRRYHEAASPVTPYDWYECTETGIEAARASFYRRRYSKAKRMYSLYLDLSDGCDLQFRDFLTDPEFAAIRRDA
jgi:hypothetical protein